MCDICRQSPCHPRCPNVPEPKAIEYCACCGEPITAGYDMYEIDGQYYCEDCVTSTWFEEDDKDFTECESCGEEIKFGDECYRVGNKHYCNDCVSRTIAEDDWW